MNYAKESLAAELIRIQKNKSRWKKAVMCMAVAVVFVTTYMLILPAITMSNDTAYCGEEHEHNVECYAVPTSENQIADQESLMAESESDAGTTSDGSVTTEDTSGELETGADAIETEDQAVSDLVEEGRTELTYTDESIQVQVTRIDGEAFGADAELNVTELEMSDGEYIEISGLEAMNVGNKLLENKQYTVSVIDGEPLIGDDVQMSFTYRPSGVDNGSDAQAVITGVTDESTQILASEEVADGEEVETAVITGDFQNYGVALFAARTSDVPAGQYGSYTLQYNDVKDTFVKDAAYDIYYNENSPLGTAGSFHIVGFDTVYLKAHCNGNVLARALIANSNFGTNGLPDELSYIQDYQQINGTSASGTNHILALGSINTITLRGNNDELHVNNKKIDKPYNMVLDTDTDANPFIDLERVEAEIRGISARLASVKTTGVTASFDDQNNRNITLNNPESTGVYSTTAQALQSLPHFDERKLKLKGFAEGKNGTIVITVDCTGVNKIKLPEATVFIGDQEQSTNETTVFSSGKVIWNFTNAEGVVIETKRMTGMVVAPGAEVHITQNLNGTVVAEDVYVEAESHRTDFTGSVETPTHPIMVRKVDADNISVYLDGAEFDLYKWNSSTGKYELLQSEIGYESGQALNIPELTYNQAYRLVETKAPAGYEVSNVPYDFLIKSTDTWRYPIVKPNDGSKINELNGGQTVYFKNEKTTNLTIQKEWLNKEGQPMTEVAEREIKVDVWKNVYTDQERLQLAYSAECRTDLTVSASDDWSLTITDLSDRGTEIINGVYVEVYYTYFVKEHPNDNYNVAYDDNGGIVSGTITVTNQERVQYVIPETGGPGTHLYMLAGLMMITAGLALMLLHRIRRREAEG